MNGKPRIYDEAKAERVEKYRQIFQEKLTRLLKTRTTREEFLKAELDAIAAAYVYVKCGECSRVMAVKYTDWCNGKYVRTCKECTKKQLKADMGEALVKIRQVLPDSEWSVTWDRYSNYTTLTLSKKKA